MAFANMPMRNRGCAEENAHAAKPAGCVDFLGDKPRGRRALANAFELDAGALASLELGHVEFGHLGVELDFPILDDAKQRFARRGRDGAHARRAAADNAVCRGADVGPAKLDLQLLALRTHQDPFGFGKFQALLLSRNLARAVRNAASLSSKVAWLATPDSATASHD